MLIAMALCWSAQAVEERHGILVGEVVKVDDATKAVVVKTADGTEHTLHFVKETAVHGAQETTTGSEDAFHDLKEGSHVAVHYTAKGTEETAYEIDDIGKDGLKATDATVVHIDRGTKTLAVKTADGTEEIYHLTDSAARDAGKDISEDAEKSTKVTIYYTERAGDKVAYFFQRAI
jgi:arginine repressor